MSENIATFTQEEKEIINRRFANIDNALAQFDNVLLMYTITTTVLAEIAIQKNLFTSDEFAQLMQEATSKAREAMAQEVEKELESASK